MKVRAWIVAMSVVLAVGAARPAHAEESAYQRHQRRRTTAVALSGIGIGVSSALSLSAFLFPTSDGGVNRPLLISGLATSIVTPSLGEFYAGKYLTIGMGIRAAAAGLALFGATRTQDIRCETGPPTSVCTELRRSAIAYLGLAAIAYVGGAAWDVDEAGDVVDRKDHYVLGPIAMPSGAGLALGGRF